jgi:hypothetical protein
LVQPVRASSATAAVSDWQASGPNCLFMARLLPDDGSSGVGRRST